jgi:hypothetical protein
VIELQIPFEIPSQNTTDRGRTHHARAAKKRGIRNAWALYTRSEMNRLGVPAPDGPRRLHIIAYRTQRCHDTSNLIGGAKACVDGMADAGLVLNDRDSLAHITYEQQVASKSPTRRPHTTIQIDPPTPIPGKEHA